MTAVGSEWTKIVDGTQAHDVLVSAASGAFLTSLGHPVEKGAHTLSVPPVAGGAFRQREVCAGIAVYAKAISAPAVASIEPAQV